MSSPIGQYSPYTAKENSITLTRKESLILIAGLGVGILIGLGGTALYFCPNHWIIAVSIGRGGLPLTPRQLRAFAFI